MKRQRLMELAGVQLNEYPSTDAFREAIKTIAQYLVNEADGSADADELLEGRWIEMLRDEINDLVDFQPHDREQPYDATLMDPEANRRNSNNYLNQWV